MKKLPRQIKINSWLQELGLISYEEETHKQDRYLSPMIRDILFLSKEDYVIQKERRQRLKKYEHELRRFRYQSALASLLKDTSDPVIVVSMFEELLFRGGLKTSLKGLNEVTILPILEFLNKHITHTRYASILLQVMDSLLGDIWSFRRNLIV